MSASPRSQPQGLKAHPLSTTSAAQINRLAAGHSKPARGIVKPPTRLQRTRTEKTASGTATSVNAPKGARQVNGASSCFRSRTLRSTIAVDHASSPASFETDPERTSTLWSSVMGLKRGSSSIPITSGRGGGKAKSIQSRSSQQTAITEESSSACRPGSRDFEEAVLAPRGITISREEPFVTPFTHFRTTPPRSDGGRGAHYRAKPPLRHTTIWLDHEPEFLEEVRDEYQVKTYRRRQEAEFQVTALTKLLLAERLRLRWPTERQFLPERYLQPILKPRDHLWSEPPITRMNKPCRPYTFDIRPDCTYWVSLEAFSAKWRRAVRNLVSIYSDHEGMLCPYLTIEFKKDGSDIVKAEQQVAIAGSLALYNRWVLYMRRLSGMEQSFNSLHQRKIRHYGLTFSGANYLIWCLMPVVCEKTGDWQGCRMFTLSGGTCSQDLADVEDLIDWLNEIHAWGISVHGEDVQMDLKVILHQASGAPRTSLSDEELQKLAEVSLDEMEM